MRRVLAHAWLLYRDGGGTMLDAVDEAANGGAEGEYAKVELRRVLLHINLVEWERHPARLRSDVHHLLRRTIGKLTPHRGGWRVAR